MKENDVREMSEAERENYKGVTLDISEKGNGNFKKRDVNPHGFSNGSGVHSILVNLRKSSYKTAEFSRTKLSLPNCNTQHRCSLHRCICHLSPAGSFCCHRHRGSLLRSISAFLLKICATEIPVCISFCMMLKWKYMN